LPWLVPIDLCNIRAHHFASDLRMRIGGNGVVGLLRFVDRVVVVVTRFASRMVVVVVRLRYDRIRNSEQSKRQQRCLFHSWLPFVPPRCTVPEIDRVRRKSNALSPSEWQRTRM
jgi:hypothetical protein